jgi:hypothetical protein
VTSKDEKIIVTTRIGSFCAFIVLFHILGGVLYLLTLDFLSRRLAFSVAVPSVLHLNLSLLFLSIPTAVFIYVFERSKGRLLLESAFRVFFAAFVILLLAVVLLNFLIPEPLMHPI